jgi:prepilin-type N-terminal cleavage/methylation domain-containing protein
MNARGFSLLELLVAVAIGSIAVLGLGKLFVSTVSWGRQDDRLTYMARQGTVILDEMGRRVRGSNDMKCSPAACDPVGSDTLATCGVDPSLQVTNPDGVYCFRLDATGGQQLIEAGPGGGQNNMLREGSLASLTVSACPGTSMFSVINPGNLPGCSPTTTPCAPPNRVDICFQLSTTATPSDSMMFRTSLSRRN